MGFGEKPFYSYDWMPYSHTNSPYGIDEHEEDVPPYGIVASYGGGSINSTTGVYNLGCSRPLFYLALFMRYTQYFVNGPSPVPLGETGMCNSAIRPTLALYNPDCGDPLWGEVWGPAPGSFALHKGLPGYLIYGYRDQEQDDVIRVIRDPYTSSFWMKATADWVSASGNRSAVFANPCTDFVATNVYDGVDLSPEIEVQVQLPRNGTDRDPNIKEGNVFSVVMSNRTNTMGTDYATRFIACGGYLDDKIGTIKAWSGAVVDIPQGWRVYDALDGKYVKGDNSGLLGSGSDTVASGSGFSIPYAEVRWIERFE